MTKASTGFCCKLAVRFTNKSLFFSKKLIVNLFSEFLGSNALFNCLNCDDKFKINLLNELTESKLPLITRLLIKSFDVVVLFAVDNAVSICCKRNASA